MVVGFQLNNEDGDSGNGANRKHPTRKKYLVARSNEQINSISDYMYVFHNKPQKGAKTASSTSNKKQLTNLKDVGSFESWDPIPSDTKASEQLQQQSQHHVATKSSSKSAIRSKASSSQRIKSSAPLIRYGHVVRFQAADGGFLLVESDGCLRKVPKDHANDPRTLVTLFPRDPLANVGKQHNRRVRSGDWAFIVQGSAAALETELGIVRADSDEMIEGPAYLMSEVTRHDDAAAAASVHDLRRDHDHDQSKWRQHSYVSKQAIRKKQLTQAFPQEIESMLTTVWYLQKVPRNPGVVSSQSPSHHGDKPSATSKWGQSDDNRSSCFKHGTQLQIFQNNFVVCYELQSSKDDDDENGNNNRKSRRRSTAMSSFSPGAAAAAAVAGEKTLVSGPNTNSADSRVSPSDALLSEGQATSSFGHPNENGSIFTHVWLQETPEFTVSCHPANCSCSGSMVSNSSCYSDRRRAIWDNTWTVCDINVVESRNLRDLPPSLGSPQQDKARRRSKPSAIATTKVEPLASAESSKSEEPKVPGEDDELEPLSEEQEGDEEDEVGEEEQDTPLQRQASVFDVAKFAVKAESQQARAARIIVRFFRRVFCDEVTQSRVQDFLRRRRRLTLTKRNGETKLSTKQQLKLLQCYNPNIYGVGGGGGLGSTRWQNQQRGLLTFDKFTNSAEADRQKLATMKCEIDFLNRDWLRTERHSVQKMNSISHEMYSRRPLSSPFTPKRILANREREQQFHVEMKMARRDPPSFHYGSFQAASATRRPQTAPLAIDSFGAKSP